MFNMFVVMFALALCKLYCKFFYLLIQNGDVYMAAKSPCNQIAKLEDDLY